MSKKYIPPAERGKKKSRWWMVLIVAAAALGIGLFFSLQGTLNTSEEWNRGSSPAIYTPAATSTIGPIPSSTPGPIKLEEKVKPWQYFTLNAGNTMIVYVSDLQSYSFLYKWKWESYREQPTKPEDWVIMPAGCDKQLVPGSFLNLYFVCDGLALWRVANLENWAPGEYIQAFNGAYPMVLRRDPERCPICVP